MTNYVDGADWIKDRVGRPSLPVDATGLDFYHLADQVHKTRRIKRVGLRWDADNAETIRMLEALDQSGAGKDYGDCCLQQAA